jgi:hypothetical protein
MNNSSKKPVLTLVKPVAAKKKVIVKRVKPLPKPKKGKTKMNDSVKPVSKKNKSVKPAMKTLKAGPKTTKLVVKKDQKKSQSKPLMATETVEKGTVKKLLSEIKMLHKEITRRDALLKQLNGILGKHSDSPKQVAKTITAKKQEKVVKPATKTVKPVAKATEVKKQSAKPVIKTVKPVVKTTAVKKQKAKPAVKKDIQPKTE